MKRMPFILLSVVLIAGAVGGQVFLRSVRPGSAPVWAEGVFAALGGFRSIAAEVVWFRADRLQEEGRYVELAQLADVLTFLEPHTPEVWSYAAWNMSYNISVMMATHEDRWRWVMAGLRLLRDRGLVLNPASSELYRELAWLFELKIGANIDAASALYREKWKAIVEDVRARGAWDELRMDSGEMARVTQATGFDDWTDPQLSAIYWAAKGGAADIVQQATILYRRTHPDAGRQPPAADR